MFRLLGFMNQAGVPLVVVLSLILAGCAEENPTRPPGGNQPTFDTIWPAAAGQYLVYDLEDRTYEDNRPLYDRFEDVPPLPTMEELHAAFGTGHTGVLLEVETGRSRHNFLGDATVDPDTTVLIVDTSIEHLDGDPGLPFGLRMGSIWRHSGDRIAAYGHGELQWVHVDGSLAPGHEFSEQLVSGLSSGIHLAARIWAIRSHEAAGEDYPGCVEVFYLLDMGIQEARDESGASMGFFHSHVYGTTVYAPGVGPVHCEEAGRFGPGQSRERRAVLAERGHSEEMIETPAIVLDTWGRRGSDPGRFDTPEGIAVDPTGTVFVVDSGNSRVQSFSPDGTFLDTWGQWGCSTEPDGSMSWPHRIAFHPSGNLMVTDESSSCRSLYAHVFQPDGTHLTRVQVATIPSGFGDISGLVASGDSITILVQNRVARYSGGFEFGGFWSDRGSAPGEFTAPAGIAVGPDGFFYVTDRTLDRVTKLDAGGGFVSTWGTEGRADGEFDNPNGIAVDSHGRIYVADLRNDRIQVFNAEGGFIATFGPLLSTGDRLRSPIDVEVTREGDLLVVDRSNSRIVRLAGL